MTALLLVGLLGAVVLAVSKPVKNFQLDDQTITIGATAGSETQINLADVAEDDRIGTPAVENATGAFDDADDGDVLVYTALTTNKKAALVNLGDHNPQSIEVISTWWDALTCETKGSRLGFDPDAVDEDGDPIHVEADAVTDPQNVVVAAGLCVLYDGLPTEFGDANDVTPGLDYQVEIRRAFHWDMLNGPEMEMAALAGGLTDSAARTYKRLYGDLDKEDKSKRSQRNQVEDFFDDGVLAMGIGTLVLTNYGIDGLGTTPPLNLTDNTRPGEGAAGTATVYVKVSDKDGRLLSSGSDGTVGQKFDVTANLTAIPDTVIVPFGADVTGNIDDTLVSNEADSASAKFRRPIGSSNALSAVDMVPGPPAVPAHVLIKVSPGTTDIIDIDLTPGTGAVALMPHHQKVNFNLSNGTSPFSIRKLERVDSDDDGDVDDEDAKVYDRAEIVVRPGERLSAGSPYKFTLTVNEFENAPNVSASVDIWVEVVVDNIAPEFTGTPPTAGSIEERERGVTIADFDASDENNQLLTYSVVAAEVVPANGDDTGSAHLLRCLEIDDEGVLKTKALSEGEVLTNGDCPNFNEDDEDDPETEDVDESKNKKVNSYKLAILVTDGTETSRHVFTLTVTDDDDPAPGQSQRLRILEDNQGGLSNSFGSAPALVDGEETPGDFSLGQQLNNKGDIANQTENPDDILFEIDPSSGKLYLKEAAARARRVDFESGITTYNLSVSRDNGRNGFVVVDVVDVNEAPMFSEADDERADKENDGDDQITLYVLESDPVGTTIKIGKDAGGNPSTVNAIFAATDEDANLAFKGTAYDLWYDGDDENDELDDAYEGTDALVYVDSDGAIKVNKILDTDADDSQSFVVLKLRAYDTTEDIPDAVDENDETPEELRRVLIDTLDIRIEIIDTNVAPVFDAPSRLQTHASVSEGAVVGTVVYTYLAEDEDGDTVRYRLRDQDDAPFFTVEETKNTAGVEIGVLKTNAGLDYETQTSHTVEIQAYDTDGDTDEIVITIDVTNANDNSPVFGTIPPDPIRVPENSPRGTSLGSFAATDADGDTVTYSLSGTNAKSFHIDGDGELKTLESLDYDSNTPCPAAGCSVTIVASDANAASGAPTSAHTGPAEAARTIMILPIEDSVSTLKVTKANPVPGTSMGVATTALAGTKTSDNADVPERPADLPSTYTMDGKTKVPASSPLNFVDTEWGNWGTVLRIEVTSQSPLATCDGGNECVVINVNSDSADDTLQLKAYRMDTPAGAASNENKFVAAVMLVEYDGDATNVKGPSGNDIPVYKHTDGSVPRLKVDEEDEIEIEFGNLRSSVDVENEAPEIDNFTPSHEMAFDDADVDYAFTIKDAHSGLPEPEDLPDTNGNDEYTPVVALISRDQCETHANTATVPDVLKAVAQIHEDETLYCPGTAQSGEYLANVGGYGFAPIRDDKDFDEIDDGYDVETTIVLTENKTYFVTFIVCDNAGNCTFYDPDGNDDMEELAQITVDTEDPDFVEARTGIKWDSTDNEYDDDRSFIQVIFDELTELNTETVEIDDFVVEGHSIKEVYVFETPDADDVTWGDSGKFAREGSVNLRKVDRYRDIENTVFIELEDELLADETPDVTLVPNGVEDGAGNEQDDGEQEADDWISPKFTIVSIVSPRETTQDQVLAGDDEEVVITITTDERLDQTRPTVTVTYVNAAAGSIDTVGTDDCKIHGSKTDETGTRDRGEIVNDDYCQNNGAATGGTLNNSVEKVSNTEWVVTITEPKDTGYYNFHITGIDRSPEENRGSEGVSPGAIVTDFFDSDGDVNFDDAVFFEGDINLSRPNVRVSGEVATDNEPDVEYRTPLFVELDFTAPHATAADCRDESDDDHALNCMAETSEYAQDNFDSIVVTLFELDGVDITDSVKTTDDETFLVTLENISIGDHTVNIQAVDQAGNVLDDILEIDFEVSDRDPFEKRLSPGWNLVSLPGSPADSSIAAVFGANVEVRTVYTYDPVIPGGWQVAVRETLDSDWQGDLTEISGQRGYWVLSDAIQDWEVNIPRLAGGASGTGTPIQPPVIPLYAGWNLIPVTDVRGNALDDGSSIEAETYLNSLDDGLDLARVLGFNTIKNQWSTVLDPDTAGTGELNIGSAYWVFVREAASLVPGGLAN